MTNKSVDELIDGFFNNTLSDSDYRDLYDILRDKKKPAPPKEPVIEAKPKIGQVTEIIYGAGEVGFKLACGGQILFNKKGGVRTLNGKRLEDDEWKAALLHVPVDLLAELWAAGVVMHETDKKLLTSQVNGLEQKTRYIDKTNKKMFATGVALGRQKS